MKKELLKAKMLLVALMMGVATMFVSCADDSTDDEGGKANAVQLATPEFTSVDRGAGDTTAKLTVAWGYVDNADFYTVSVVKTAQVGDEGKVEVSESVYDNTTDRNSISFDVVYGGEYAVSVTADSNSKGYTASDAAETVYFWYVAPVTVEAGDLATILPDMLKAVEGNEATFALVAGRNYTLSAPVDFGAYRVTIKSMANVGTEDEPVIVENGAHAVVTYGEQGVIRVGNSLTMINVSVDAAQQKTDDVAFDNKKVQSVISASEIVESGELLSTNVLQLQAINLQNCYFKDVPANFINLTVSHNWAAKNITIDGCIVQMANNGSIVSDGAFIQANKYSYLVGDEDKEYSVDNYWGSSLGGVKEFTMTNSTVYNIYDDAKNTRFFYWGQGHGKNLKKTFGEGATGFGTIENCTLVKTFAAKEFANQCYQSDKGYVINFNNNVCSEVQLVTKWIDNNNIGDNTGKADGNVMWFTAENDLNQWNKEDGSHGDYARLTNTTMADPGFAATLPSLDFTAENGYGTVSFKTSYSKGDPRWN